MSGGSFKRSFKVHKKFHILHTHTVRKSWWGKVIPDRTNTMYYKRPVTWGSYAWCWWSIIRTSLSNNCTLIYQDGVETIHAQRCIGHCEMQSSLITADFDVLGECVHFINCVTTGEQDKSDKRRHAGLLYLWKNVNSVNLEKYYKLK